MSGNDQSTLSSSHPLLAGWNESYGFRETFLSLFTQPGYATALTLVTAMLHEYAMEQARHWPDPGESTTRRELLAAAAAGPTGRRLLFGLLPLHQCGSADPLGWGPGAGRAPSRPLLNYCFPDR